METKPLDFWNKKKGEKVADKEIKMKINQKKSWNRFKFKTKSI